MCRRSGAMLPWADQAPAEPRTVDEREFGISGILRVGEDQVQIAAIVRAN